MIAMDFLSTMTAVEGKRWIKNPETRRIRELLDQEKGRVKLMWIPSHSEITGNERVDEAAKNALKKDINNRELYPPQHLINLMKKNDGKNRQERWAQGKNTMRFRKETIEWKDDSTNPSRKERVVVSRLRTRYTRATHTHVIEKTPSTEYPLCGVSLTTKHILWESTETSRGRERERNWNHEKCMD
jgi:hypothetical protein